MVETQHPELTAAPTVEEAVERLVVLATSVADHPGFLRASLPVIAETLHAVSGRMDVACRTNAVQASWSSQSSNGDFWAPTLEHQIDNALTEGKPAAKLFRSSSSDVVLALLTSPISAPSAGLHGAIALIAPVSSQDADREAQEKLTHLSAFVGLLTTLTPGRVSEEGSAGGDHSALRKVAEFESSRELAFAIANRLRTRDGCEQVAVGLETNGKVRILAVSGLDQIPDKSPGIRALQEAMDECADLEHVLVAQDADKSGDFDADVLVDTAMHRKWRIAADGSPVISLPMHGKDCQLILSVRRRKAFGPSDIAEYKELVEPYSAAIHLVDRASETLSHHVRRSTVRAWRAFVAPRGWGKKVAAIGIVAFGLWAFFGSLAYRVSAPCAVTAADVRHIGATQSGLLRASHVLPGVRVEKGQVLCEFDTREFQLEIARLESELVILEMDESRALADGVPADLQLAKASQAQTRAQLDLLHHQVERSVVRAPSDGVVMSGDLRERVGDVFSKGETLFELASGGAWQLEVFVPESAVADLSPGMKGHFSSVARPEDEHALTLDRIDPRAERRNGENVFVARAHAEFEAAWVRAGMEGIASVDAGERTPAWLMFHGLSDWVRLHLWL